MAGVAAVGFPVSPFTAPLPAGLGEAKAEDVAAEQPPPRSQQGTSLSQVRIAPEPSGEYGLPGSPEPVVVPPLVEQVGARLQGFWRVWQYLGASPWVVTVLRRGFSLKFKNNPPPLSPSPRAFNPPSDPERRRALDAEISAMIQKAAVEPVPILSPGFYSLIFVVPKASGGWRPVIDLSALNRFLQIPSFSMETPEQIRASIPRDAWTVSLDLKDA